MSADAIVDCPNCGKHELREFHEMGFSYYKLPHDPFFLEFKAECRSCSAKYRFSYQNIAQNMRVFK